MRNKLIITLGVVLAFCGMQARAQQSTSEVSSTLRVWIDDLTLTADGETIGYLHISENDEIDYTAFQMRISVPKGIEIHKVKVGRNTYDALPTERFTNTHTVTCNLVDDGQSIKVAVMSPANDLFFPDDENGEPLDELCAIAVTADPSMINGMYTLEMNEIKFILPSSFAYIPENVTPGYLTIEGGRDPSSGIEGVDADTEQGAVYDLLGRSVSNPTQGLYIKDNKKVIIKQ